jgi:penicillin amidase
VRRPWIFLAYTAIAVCIVLVVASVFAFVTVRRPFPQTTGSIEVPGLTADVRVLRDSEGIPQVYADDASDLFFTQGFVHAQDRFFEMDFRRHVTAGRLAELVGEGALETDKFVRTLGWRRVAEKELGLLSVETLRHLQDYADGVNAYIKDRSAGQLSLEYSVLSLTGPDYVPEEWTPVDSVAWLKAIAWDLRGNMSAEIARMLSLQTREPDQVAEIFPAYPYDENPPIVQHGSVRGGRFLQRERVLQRVAPELGRAGRVVRESVHRSVSVSGVTTLQRVIARLPSLLGTGEGIGSNSWVVSGERSQTGEPLLANDPHLAPSMPGTWYQMGLHCNEVTTNCPFDVSGFTFAGMPGVVIGHNARIAWGLTTMYTDVTDLYLERVDEAAGTYAYGRRELPLRERTERLLVAGEEEPVTITVRSTRHGPLLSDVDDTVAGVGATASAESALPAPEGQAYGVALRWTGLDPGRTMDAVFAINLAGTWSEFRAAAQLMAVPSQNLVYADVDGHIGYQAPGRIPIRAPGNDGRWPVAGWDPANEWTGYIPFEELPTLLDPASGVIVTANNAVIAPKNYPYLLTSDSAYGYRSSRINELIAGGGALGVADMLRIQNDTHNANAAELTPYLLDVTLSTPYDREGQRVLRDWDFSQPADSAAAAYFNVVWRNLLELTFEDQLPEEVRPDGGERWFHAVKLLLQDPENAWWDDSATEDAVETRDDILRLAMTSARDDMTSLQARSPSLWTWGHLHRLELVSPTLGTSGVTVVEWLFNRGSYELGGGSGTVNATSWNADEGFEVTALPSMRMVVSLDDFDDSRWIQYAGQSGHPFARTYAGQTERWAAGETLPWHWSREAVEQASDDQLVLTPDEPN